MRVCICVWGDDEGFIQEGGCFYTSSKKNKITGKSSEYIVGYFMSIKPRQKNKFADTPNGKKKS